MADECPNLSDTTVYRAAAISLNAYRANIGHGPDHLWEAHRETAELWCALALERLKAAKQ